MANLEISVEEDNRDPRANVIAYRFIIRNSASSNINILDVRPIIPAGVKLIGIKDRSEDTVKAIHNQLCRDVSYLCNSLLLTRSEGTRKLVVKSWREVVDKILRPSFFSKIKRLFVSDKTDTDMMMNDIYSAVSIKIQNAGEAKRFIEGFFENVETQDDKAVISAIRYKIDQIEDCENLSKTESDRDHIAVIEPDTIFAQHT